MDTLILDEAEIKMVNIARTLKPYEEIKIVADKDGKIGSFYITRQTKFLVSKDGIIMYLK